MFNRFHIAASIALGVVSTGLGLEPAAPPPPLYTSADLVRLGLNPDIANKLDELGVLVKDGHDFPEICDPKRRVQAAYSSRRNFLVICSVNATTAEQLVRAVTHETVHVAQDCRTDLANAASYAGPANYTAQLASQLDEWKLHSMRRAYTEDQFASEVEAFFFEDKPKAVANALHTFCPKPAEPIQ